MNEKLNLVEILKDCPKGTKLYSPLFGEVIFQQTDCEGEFLPIAVLVGDAIRYFAMDGRKDPSVSNQECLLFPSKDQRDWSKFKPKKPKFDPKTLMPFDKVLIFNIADRFWNCDFYSHKEEENGNTIPYICIGDAADKIIPYNDDTKHLVGTDDEVPEYYRYWED